MTKLAKSVGRPFEIYLLRATTWALSRFGELRPIRKRLLLTWITAFSLSAIISFAITLLAPITIR